MKLLLIKVFLILLASLVIDGSQLQETFRTPKRVAFSSLVGGSSHVYWVLSILEELNNRGHSAIYITRDNQVKFGDRYPLIQTVSIGKAIGEGMDRTFIQQMRDMDMADFASSFFELLSDYFKEEYLALTDLFIQHEIDLAICDSVNSACVEAAIQLKIPFIISSTGPHEDEGTPAYINDNILNSRNPTTVDMSIWKRMHNKFIVPARVGLRLWELIKKHQKTFQELGLKYEPISSVKWKNSIKLVNGAFGFQQARPLAPLMEFVGPILSEALINQPLSPELASFLDRHQKTAYVAFGQHSVLTSQDIQMILTGLIHAYDAGDIDSFVWSITRSSKKDFPTELLSHNVSAMMDHQHPDMVVTDWAPQFAVLNHTASIMFITHGGAGSLYEAMYTGVRLIVFPFIADQHPAAVMAEKNGVGLKLDYKGTQTQATHVIQTVARDAHDYFQSNVKRLQAFVQIRSKHGVLRGADIVEEVLFTIKDGMLPHRRDARRDVSLLKAYDLDIYGMLLCFVAVIIYGIQAMVHLIVLSNKQTKIKKSF